MDTAQQADVLDFSSRLHELRTAELRRLPGESTRILHGGASASWYFRWFEGNYPGAVDRRVGVEAFMDKPDNLPDNVEWLRRTLGDIAPVPSGSVDMVFGGQVIEHLWAEDIADFLIESQRVLGPGSVTLSTPEPASHRGDRVASPGATTELPVLSIEIVSEGHTRPHARREVFCRDLGRRGRWMTTVLDFDLAEMVMGLKLRAVAHACAPFSAQTTIDVRRAEDASSPDPRSLAQLGLPEPKTVGLVGLLARRAATKARGTLRR